MMKKLILAFVMICAPICAQDFDQDSIDFAFQELIYDMGMNLSTQNLITDTVSAKNALLNLYEQVEQVTQIVDLFMMIDEELVALNITTVSDLIDFEIDNNQVMAQACMNWLSAYQYLFILFNQIHVQDISFDVWCQDVQLLGSMSEDQQSIDPVYEQLWQASYDVIQAQKVFEESLEQIE